MTERTSASWLVYALGALCAGAIVAAALVVGPASGSQASVTRTAKAARGVVQSTVSGSGNLAAASQLNLGFKTSGTVTNIDVKQGQQVSEGQLLATLDPQSAEVTLEQSKAALQSAEANLAKEEETNGETSTGSGAGGSSASGSTGGASAGAAAVTPAASSASDSATGTSADVAYTAPGAQPQAPGATTTVPSTTAPGTTTASTAPVTTTPGTSTPATTTPPTTSTTPSTTPASKSPSKRTATTTTPTTTASGKGSTSGGETTTEAKTDSSTSSSTVSTATREANLASARAAVKSDRLTVQSDEQAVQDTKLYAPEDGTIVSLTGQVGEVVTGSGTTKASNSSSSSSSGGSGTAAAGGASALGGATGSSSSSKSSSSSSSSSSAFAVLSDLSSMQLVVPLSESEIGNVKAGQPATVTVEALSGAKLAAHVSEVALLSTSSSGAVSYDVTFQLDQMEAGLKLGMSATAEVVVKQAEGVNVPTSAISADSVTVQHDGGKQERRRVTTGLAGNTSTIVLSGLKAGETVVLPTTSTTGSSAASLTSKLAGRLGAAGGLSGGGIGAGGGGFAGPGGGGFRGGG